jgi:predicted enzyme related to lactoylglutathione lyase
MAAFAFGYLFNNLISNNEDGLIKMGKSANTSADQRVTGVGGIFFKADDPIKLNEWYKTHLGLPINEFGARFFWKETDATTVENAFQWSSFNEAETAKFIAPSTKEFMINYRVKDLASMVEQLKKENVTFVDSLQTFDYGKFVHIMDIEGNKIELFEPNYSYKPEQRSMK